MTVKARWLAVLAAVVAMVAAVVLVATSAPASTPATGFDVSGVDLHDGTVVEAGGTYYLYGEEYGCGFTWTRQNTPWCGFGVSTSTDKVHWTTPQLLFDPNATDPVDNLSWQQVCGSTGADCYAPRMIQRSGWGANDGVWVLWFDAPYDWNVNHSTNSYYVMGCNGPAGPCGYQAPYGTVHKPTMPHCGGNADLDVVTQSPNPPVALCTNADQTVSEDELDEWGTNGDGTGSSGLAGLTGVEGLGAYHDSASNTWIMTYSDPNCKYCAGTQTGYATAPSLLGPWTAPSNPGVHAPPGGRRQLTPNSCGGQPDTIATLDGTPYEIVDIWSGALNEARSAPLHFEPLAYQPSGAQPGALWQPFNVWQCQ
jgi:hypothetical protein